MCHSNIFFTIDVDFKLNSQLHSGNFVQSDIRAKKDYTLDGKSGKEPKDVQETPKDVSVDPSKVNRTALKKSVAELVKFADLLVVPQRAKKTKEVFISYLMIKASFCGVKRMSYFFIDLTSGALSIIKRSENRLQCTETCD